MLQGVTFLPHIMKYEQLLILEKYCVTGFSSADPTMPFCSPQVICTKKCTLLLLYCFTTKLSQGDSNSTIALVARSAEILFKLKKKKLSFNSYIIL